VATVPQIGTLYKNPVQSGITVWVQPGGPGTLVYPQQSQGQKSALYSLGCGHWVNTLEVFEEYDPDTGIQVALLCCPACSYIQQIISPYENYSNYEITPLVLG